MPHLPFSSKDDLNNKFWENIHFGRVLVWYGGNQMIIHFFKTSEVADILFIIFFKSFWWKMASAGRN